MVRKLAENWNTGLKKLLPEVSPGLIEELTIRNKAAQLQQMRLNRGQRMLLNTVNAQRAAGRPVRVVLLKARQFGGSTLTQALLFLDSLLCSGRESWIVAHNLESSRALFSMTRRFFENWPCDPPLHSITAARDEIVLDNKSRIFASTAGNVRAGRGFTLHALHASEAAYWPDAEAAMLSLLQAVPDAPDTTVIVESTANGMGGWFHDLWRAARAGANNFAPVFVGWQHVEEYALPFSSADERREFETSMDQEEIEIMRAHALTPEQMRWRRACIRDKCGGDPDAFRQEYPSHDREAFLTSGRPVFAAPALDAMYAAAADPAFRGEADTASFRQYVLSVKKQPETIKKRPVEFMLPVRSGRLKIWDMPEPGARYVMGVDVSEGIEPAGGAREADNSCIQILRCPGPHETGIRQAACWSGKIDPDALADAAWLLAVCYNNAFTAVEANNHGLTTITSLKRDYPHLYQREVFDERGRRRTKKLGWLTTAATRPLMLDALARAIRERSLTIRDHETLAECMTFVYDKNGRMAAREGSFDDRVIALAIALQMHECSPHFEPPDKEVQPTEQRLDFLREIRSAKKGSARDGWNVV